MPSQQSLSYRSIINRAWPLVIANSSVPLLGLTDTLVLGNYGSIYDLGAVALGSLIFSFLYWGFGFLRMGTTGFVAQASGAEDFIEVRSAFVRALLTSAVIGVVLVLLQRPLGSLALGLLDGSDTVEAATSTYFSIRIWGAPATLGAFVLTGVLIGLGQSRKLLLVQLVLNGLNILLDIVFAGVLQLGAQGVAMGTLIAEWSAFAFALLVVIRILIRQLEPGSVFINWDSIRDSKRLREMLTANTNIMLRTLLLVFSFAWFTNRSAIYGDVTLAANHILLQLISFSAFFLDSFAFVAEALVGQAVGARNRTAFDNAVRKTSELALVSAGVLGAMILFFGNFIVALLTDIAAVRDAAAALVPLAALYVIVSFAAFQLDGIFIGASQTSQMRNASFVSACVFLLFWGILDPWLGVYGLWMAFIIYVCARAGALYYYFPSLRRRLVTDHKGSTTSI